MVSTFVDNQQKRLENAFFHCVSEFSDPEGRWFESSRAHHVGMDFAPFKKPSQKAGLFLCRSVIPPLPRKFLRGPQKKSPVSLSDLLRKTAAPVFWLLCAAGKDVIIVPLQ